MTYATEAGTEQFWDYEWDGCKRWERDEYGIPDQDILIFCDGESTAAARVERSSFDLSPPVRERGSSFSQDVKEDPDGYRTEVEKMESGNGQQVQAVEEQRAPPAWKVVVGGVQLAVWANTASKGGVFRTVTLARSFKRANGDWGSTASLRVNDLPKAILALQKAYERLVLEGPAGDEGTGSAGSERSGTFPHEETNEAENAVHEAARPIQGNDIRPQAGTTGRYARVHG